MAGAYFGWGSGIGDVNYGEPEGLRMERIRTGREREERVHRTK